MTLQVRACLQRGDFTLDVDCELPLQGVTALFGRSGCGKTTLLRVIAGLERAADAEVRFGGQVWQRGRDFVPLHRRRIGLVFQEHSLLEHLSVRGNLLYGYARTPAALRRLHLDDVGDMLDLGALLSRRIDQLSGGQRQRVSLGRALLTSPQLLLLDEPLAALDTRTRSEIMPFLSRMASEAGVPIILISHAPDEVERLADRVLFMHQGRIDAQQPLQQALARSDSPLFVEHGAVSVLCGSLSTAKQHGLRAFTSDGLQLWLPDVPQLPCQPSRVRILARDVSLALDRPERISILNHLPVSLERIEPLDAARCLVFTRTSDGQQLLAEVTHWSAQQLGLRSGMSVHALIKSVALMA